MFDTLTGKLQQIFRDLLGLGKLTEKNISDTLREVRIALLEADVNYHIVRDFLEKVKQKAIGLPVIQSIQPGQQFIKIIYDEMVELLGSSSPALELKDFPAVIMLIGLHGSGKTTTAAKLALWLREQRKRPMLVAADVYRPAAIDQLEILGKQIKVPFYSNRNTQDVVKIALEAKETAQQQDIDVLIVDTAGRLHIDEELIEELKLLKHQLVPSEVLLVLDAATGQEAVNIARRFDQEIGITGAILTKLDGDARGGAALSFRAVVNKPIKFIGIGEKLEDFDVFNPVRMAQRILGMGDVVALVEKAAKAIDEQEAKRLEERLRKGQFTLEDLLVQLRHIRKLGSLDVIMGLIPGVSQLSGKIDIERAEKELRRMEGIICAMTPQERRNPDILNARRRQRIAKGSGVTVTEVNNLLKRFYEMQKMLKKLGKFEKLVNKKGILPTLFKF